ncbi:DUF4434 domain-containing protein [Pseudidiomarina homiensis]|uniref:DUF4434 domain-containing protein n=1 Tax=Pseudidiomarina homiensis TaxID=364198 RepID=A0A432Y728_9GAMM|nr:DUF4434 domain-containing protein [Pseudidiomarina homiensis]RUO56691.1 hypothetical protein CWI70_08160 [Pseudidiomarina homiensis]
MAARSIKRLCRRQRQRVYCAFSALLLTVFLGGASQVTANDELQLGVMYQPLNRDADLGAHGWRYLLQQVIARDIDFGVLQWTQYGAEGFQQPRPWLVETATLWQHEMPLWLGLHTEPEYFAEMAKGAAAQQVFFEAYLRKVNASVAQWQLWTQQHREQFLGWYVPLELSDAYFASAAERAQLHSFLADLKQRLGPTPTAISLFLSAAMAPEDLGEWLVELQDLGYEVWLQDGVGTQALSETDRRQYFAKLNCKVVLINEAFVQTSQQPFQARPARNEELKQAMAEQPDCHRRILFSLRYLPETSGLLYLSDVTKPPQS